ncbi:hypothetical protein [Ralstonia phage RP13]|nr:hypothetical protein [Ralstonia phage RP13]
MSRLNSSNIKNHGISQDDIVTACKVLSAVPVGGSVNVPLLKLKRVSHNTYVIDTCDVEETTNANDILFGSD